MRCFPLPRSWLGLLSLIALSLAITLGCARSAPPAPKPYPTSIAAVDELKKGGVSWTNEEIRAHYNVVVGAIAKENERWKQEGLSVEERAKRAYQIRHDARLLSRAMMGSGIEVQLLERRDREKYGSPDGPTFDWLVESAKKKGVTGDAVYEGIVESSQRTDEATNAAFGVKKAP